VDAVCRSVGVGVVNRALHRRQHEHFVGSQVELDARRVARPAERPAIPDTPLCRLGAARIGEYLELARFGGKLQAAGVVDPLAHFLEDPGEKAFVKVIGVLQREIQVFRESVGLEIALSSGRCRP
jgi:hypothetical protein